MHNSIWHTLVTARCNVSVPPHERVDSYLFTTLGTVCLNPELCTVLVQNTDSSWQKVKEGFATHGHSRLGLDSAPVFSLQYWVLYLIMRTRCGMAKKYRTKYSSWV